MNSRENDVHTKEVFITLVSNRGRNIRIRIDRPEILGGATALIFNGEPKEEEFVKNPLTNENIPVIKGTDTRFLIPAHIKEDYEYATANNMPIKQVIAPYFLGTGEETVRDNVETQNRHSVIAIIKHNEEDKYLCLDCKGRSCKSFVLGGIEPNEGAEQAAIREVYEETGYSNIVIDRKSRFKIINHFYAGYKGVNRYAVLEIVFGRLADEMCEEISEEESKKHVVKWIDKNELIDFISVNNNRYALEMLLNGETAWIGDGVMINSGKLNGVKSQQVGKILTDMLLKDKEEIEI